MAKLGAPLAGLDTFLVLLCAIALKELLATKPKRLALAIRFLLESGF
jgi:hypothetical protein